MSKTTDNKDGSNTSSKPKRKPPSRFRHVTPSRIALGSAGLIAAGATGYQNVKTWAEAGATPTEQVVNAALSGGFELAGLGGLAWAGYQATKKRYLRSAFAATFAAGAIYFNTGATERYHEAQDAVRENAIEAAAADVPGLEQKILALDVELQSIITQNGGTVPRTLEIIEAAYSHLDPDANPVNMARKAVEEGLRREYDRIKTEGEALQDQLAEAQVQGNDIYKPIIPKDQRLAFIWSVEIFKGTVFFALGTTKLPTPKRPSRPAASAPANAPPQQPIHQPVTPARRERTAEENQRARGYAIARQRGWGNRR